MASIFPDKKPETAVRAIVQFMRTQPARWVLQKQLEQVQLHMQEAERKAGDETPEEEFRRLRVSANLAERERANATYLSRIRGLSEDPEIAKISGEIDALQAQMGLLMAKIPYYTEPVVDHIFNCDGVRVVRDDVMLFADRLIFDVMGNHTISLGMDEMGHYLSYYDRWDLSESIEGYGGIAGKPFEIYDRIYYDSITFEPLRSTVEGVSQPTDTASKAPIVHEEKKSLQQT